MATIELKDIKKDYRNDTIVTHALSGVDLKIDAGEFVAIMGTSGSGKTTLLNIIGCMDIPTSGTYCFENMKLNNATEKKLSSIRGKKISFIFQHFALIDDYTVFENVETPLIKQSLSKSERKKKVLEEYVFSLEDGVWYEVDGYLISRQKLSSNNTLNIIENSSNIVISPDNTGSYIITLKK